MADDDVEHGVNQITIDFIVFEEDARVEDEVAFIVDVVFKGFVLLIVRVETERKTGTYGEDEGAGAPGDS